ncbi:MAG: hypothetical protein RL616_443, partial [Verrucomicrobiota bacterium]
MKPPLLPPSLRNIFFTTVVLAGVAGADFLRGATIALNATDAINTTSFNAGLHWTGGAVPTNGNAYQTAAFLLRSPTASTPVVFAGDSLEIMSGGGELRLKTIATVTITNLILDNGAILDLTAPNGGTTETLAGNITLNGTPILRSGIQAVENVDVLTVAASMGGPGGFNTTGSFGTIILTASNTCSGLTTVNGGIVLVNGVQANSPVNIASGTLGGSGIILAAVTNQAAGNLQPGAGGGNIATLTISNLLVLAGTNTLVLNRTNAPNASRLTGISTLTAGGTFTVTNTGPALQAGDTFQLFNAASYTGNFAALNLPTLNSNLVWVNNLAVNGSLLVVAPTFIATNSPSVTNLAASGVLATAATLNGQVTSTGGQSPTVKIYFGTANGGTNPAAWTTNVSLGAQGGAFSAAVSNLTANTTYYFAAFATNAAGATWAAPALSFTTLTVAPIILTNLPAANVQGASAILNGQVVSIGNSTPNVTLFYGPSNGGTNSGAWANSIYLGAQGGSFSVTAMGLVTNTLYYFTAAAVNADGTAWATPALSFTTLPTAPVVSVLTYHYDNARSGANTNEVLLTPSQVNINNFGRLIKYTTDGYIYTQPLYVLGVNIPGIGVRNVVYVASEHDTVYAFDADSSVGANGGLLWKTNLGIASLNALGPYGRRYTGVNNPFTDITPEVGVTGTPVIDPVTGTLYVNVFTREVSGTTNYLHRLHALNLTNGTERSYSPVVVSGSVPGTGVDSVGGVMTFNAMQSNQRAALTLAGGILYVAYAGYADTDPYHGWLFGYNATNLAQVSIYNTTPNATNTTTDIHAAEGGIWMGGHGLVADANTNLYFITGNGTFRSNNGDYSDTVMKMATTNGLTVADYFTPYNQLALANADTDLGSVGPVLLPDSIGNGTHPHLLAAGGKSGTIYLLDRDNLGHFNAANDSQIVQSVIGATASIWSSPAYWNNRLFYQPANAAMKGFSISNASINATAFATAGASFGAYNGSPVVSANGTNNGIVWVVNGVGGGATAVLYAYNATNLATLYNSSQLLARDNPGGGIKMTTPTVANGKVYVGAQYALNIYGFNTFLATPTISPNGASYTNSVTVTLADATPGATIYYTLDGTTPTTNSLLYTAPFVVTTTLNVSAMAVKSGAAI